MIPKKIHYCWFGGKPLTPMAEKCIASWREKMPDYEIVEWNESNFDFSSCEFALKAYENKKWAFVSDYCRTWVLYNHGGIYLDTDVTAYKKFDDILNSDFFIGCEDVGWLESSTIGALPGHELIKTVLESFQKTDFDLNKGWESICTMPMRLTDAVTARYGLRRVKNKITRLPDATIYPREYFSPLLYGQSEAKITENTYTVHLFNASWIENKNKAGFAIKRFIKRVVLFFLGYKGFRKLFYGKSLYQFDSEAKK